MFEKELEAILKGAEGHRVFILHSGGDVIGVLKKVTGDILYIKSLVGLQYLNRKAVQIIEIHDYDAEEEVS